MRTQTHTSRRKTGRQSTTNLLLGGRIIGGFHLFLLLFYSYLKIFLLQEFISETTIFQGYKLNGQVSESPVPLSPAWLLKLPEQTAPIAQGRAFSFPVKPKQAQT